jgi:hypothetical protein
VPTHVDALAAATQAVRHVVRARSQTDAAATVVTDTDRVDTAERLYVVQRTRKLFKMSSRNGK